MKKKIVLLSVVFLAFLTLGIWLNTQRGIYHLDKFWREESARVFRAGNGDSIKYFEDGGNINFSLKLGSRDVTAVAREEGDKTELAFSDGWTAVLHGYEPEYGWPFDERDEIAIDDMDAMGLAFSAATGAMSREPFYDEDGEAIGETLMFDTESGESIYVGEKWYASDGPANDEDYVVVGSTWYNIGKSADELNAVTLKNGTSVTTADWDSGATLYQNERAEYLLDERDLFYIDAGGAAQSRTGFARFLMELTAMRVGMRGELTVVFLYVFLYAAGALTFLFPEKAAFLGSRWRFKNDPQLSEAGVGVEIISGVCLMAASVFLVFVPLFISGV